MAAAGTPIVLPTGVMKYHGAHLPAGVGLMIVTEVLRRLGNRIVVLPPLPMARQAMAWQARGRHPAC